MPDQLEVAKERTYALAYDKIIEEHLEPLNQRIVAAKWDHLRRISSVIAVAGGPSKLNALWTVILHGYLSPQTQIVTSLSTDSETATKLLDALKAVKENDAMRQLYLKMIRKLFRGKVKRS